MSTVIERMAPSNDAARTRARVLRRIDYLRADLADDVAGLRESIREAREHWAVLCREVVAGRTEQAHADRGALKQIVDATLQTTRSWLRLAGEVAELAGQEVEGAADLKATSEEAERYWANIFAGWQTTEDLEDLVANATAPAREQIDAVTRKYGFPHAWHLATDSPA